MAARCARSRADRRRAPPARGAASLARLGRAQRAAGRRGRRGRRGAPGRRARLRRAPHAPRGARACSRSRVDSTRALVAAIGALPAPQRPRVLVSASAVGYYGSRGDEPARRGRGARGGLPRRGLPRLGGGGAGDRAPRSPLRGAADRSRAGARGRRAAADGAPLSPRPGRTARRRPPMGALDPRGRRRVAGPARRCATTATADR